MLRGITLHAGSCDSSLGDRKILSHSAIGSFQSWVVLQLMRKLIHTMFITKNNATLHLGWKKKIGKYQKVSNIMAMIIVKDQFKYILFSKYQFTCLSVTFRSSVNSILIEPFCIQIKSDISDALSIDAIMNLSWKSRKCCLIYLLFQTSFALKSVLQRFWFVLFALRDFSSYLYCIICFICFQPQQGFLHEYPYPRMFLSYI